MSPPVPGPGQRVYPDHPERREKTDTIRLVAATIDRMDRIRQKRGIESSVRSLAPFSEKGLLVPPGEATMTARLGYEPEDVRRIWAIGAIGSCR